MDVFLRILYAYIPSQKLDTIKIWVFRDITKIWKNQLRGQNTVT